MTSASSLLARARETAGRQARRLHGVGAPLPRPLAGGRHRRGDRGRLQPDAEQHVRLPAAGDAAGVPAAAALLQHRHRAAHRPPLPQRHRRPPRPPDRLPHRDPDDRPRAGADHHRPGAGLHLLLEQPAGRPVDGPVRGRPDHHLLRHQLVLAPQERARLPGADVAGALPQHHAGGDAVLHRRHQQRARQGRAPPAARGVAHRPAGHPLGAPGRAARRSRSAWGRRAPAPTRCSGSCSSAPPSSPRWAAAAHASCSGWSSAWR